MTEFCDSTGRTWSLTLTLGSAKNIYDKTGVDLLNPATLMTTDDNGEMDMNLSTLPRFFTDDLFVSSIIVNLLSKQAKERGVTEDEILNLFDGETFKKAHDAFMKEYRLFFAARKNQAGVQMVEMIQQGIKKLEEESNGETSLQ
jgi:hypothetical protein